MMRKTAIGVAVGLLLAAVAAHGHGPRFHKLRLVTFNRPLPAPGFTLSNPEGE
ncbi:MAG: hypothetical protein GWO39_12525, partial [Gammaproteobacteria bacterium]|nr:hypothetical protein [Gammaproteobacteria bacterium]NIY33143.1 hypothetical protein [Gammaproteobacteria bacterium]